MVEVDAHNAVYQAFNAADPAFIRGKIDADVVLHPDALLRVSGLVSHHSWIDPQTHDYFTDAPLYAGVAFYGSGVRFTHQTLTLKCDRDVASQRNPTRMGVIGHHAPGADEWTGFRYGFHRGLKSQLPVYESVRAAWRRHKDRIRLMALRGFDVAQSDLYLAYHTGKETSPMDHNYGNSKLRELFDRYSDEAVPLPPRTWR
jgi:hypothetical protein